MPVIVLYKQQKSEEQPEAELTPTPEEQTEEQTEESEGES